MAPAPPRRQPRGSDALSLVVLPAPGPNQRDVDAGNAAAPLPATRTVIVARQDPIQAGFTITLDTITPVPAYYGSLYGSPGPGAVVGIVIGSVAAFLLLLALLYGCCSFNPTGDGSSWVTPSMSLRSRGRHRSPSRRSGHRSKHRVSRVSETVEVRASSRRPSSSRPAAIIIDSPGAGVEEVVVMRDGRRRSMNRPIAVPVVPVAPRGHVSDDEDNEVVVVEEHSPPRRSSSRRNSGVYRESRRYSRG